MNNKKLNKKLTERAEDFIIEHDIHAIIIKDGQIKNGAKLLKDFIIDLYNNGLINIGFD